MTKRKDMTKDERSLLLFFEACAVDFGGRVDIRHMNEDDMKIAKQWDKEEFINFGRIKFADINGNKSNWCKLSKEAFDLAHQERRARAERMWKSKSFMTTKEKREVDDG